MFFGFLMPVFRRKQIFLYCYWTVIRINNIVTKYVEHVQIKHFKICHNLHPFCRKELTWKRETGCTSRKDGIYVWALFKFHWCKSWKRFPNRGRPIKTKEQKDVLLTTVNCRYGNEYIKGPWSALQGSGLMYYQNTKEIKNYCDLFFSFPNVIFRFSTSVSWWS